MSTKPSPMLSAPDIEARIRALIARQSCDEACDLLSTVVIRLSKEKQFHGRQTFLPGMDDIVQTIGMELLADATTCSDAVAGAAAKPEGIPVIVATELLREGGHSRIVEDLVRIHGTALVILTNYFAGSPRPANILPAAVGGLPSLVLPQDTPTNNIRRLNKICNSLASRVYLLSHHHDVVACAALSTAMRAPVFFIHHSDFKVTLGATMKSLQHVDILPSIAAHCTTHLQREVDFWPVGVADLGSKKFEYPLKNPCTASSGNRTKFAWDGPLAYPRIVRSLLAGNVSEHLHIGALSPAELQQIQVELAGHGIPASRFRYIEQVDSLWQCLLEQPVHLFVGSAPASGLRTAIEVVGAGIPLLTFTPKAGEPFDDCPLLQYAAAGWGSIEELLAVTKRTLDQHPRAAADARQHYEQNFSLKLMCAAIDNAMKRITKNDATFN